MAIKSKIDDRAFSCAILLLLLLLPLAGCHHADEPEQKAAVQLTAVDTGVVDAPGIRPIP